MDSSTLVQTSPLSFNSKDSEPNKIHIKGNKLKIHLEY
jgi:hypothetical protein